MPMVLESEQHTIHYSILRRSWFLTITDLVLLARLELIVQELAGLLIAAVHLKAFEEGLLVIGTHSLWLLHHLLRLVLIHGWLLSRRSRASTSTRQGFRGSAHGAVGNGGTSPKGHTLSNGGPDS